MSLADLPLEIVRYIVEEIVIEPDKGLYNALRCRLISQTFDREVLDTIRSLEILHPRNASYGLWEQVSLRFVSRFLCHLIETEDQKHRYTFASSLKMFLDEWLPSEGNSRGLRFELAFQLCNIVYQQTGETFQQICDVYFPFYQLSKDRSRDIKSHLAIAAIYLNKEQYVKDHRLVLLQPDMKSEFFGTPLHAACAVGDLSLARLLLQNGANPNKQSLSAWYPVEIAVLNNHVDVVRELLQIEHYYLPFTNRMEFYERMEMPRLCLFLLGLGKRHVPSSKVIHYPETYQRWFNHLRATHNAADMRESLILLRIHFMLFMDEIRKELTRSDGKPDDYTPSWELGHKKYGLLEVAHDEELAYEILDDAHLYFAEFEIN
ncbi:hypothetical protein IWX49DRAFT_591726 [Phyllosticta citricarpa]